MKILNETITYNHPYLGEIELEVTIDQSDCYGWFEYYDTESGGEQCHSEGGLWFDGSKELIDYDGVFELPNKAIELINKLGYKTNKI